MLSDVINCRAAGLVFNLLRMEFHQQLWSAAVGLRSWLCSLFIWSLQKFLWHHRELQEETQKTKKPLSLNTIPFCLFFFFKERKLVLSVAVLRVVHLREDSDLKNMKEKSVLIGMCFQILVACHWPWAGSRPCSCSAGWKEFLGFCWEHCLETNVPTTSCILEDRYWTKRRLCVLWTKVLYLTKKPQFHLVFLSLCPL